MKYQIQLHFAKQLKSANTNLDKYCIIIPFGEGAKFLSSKKALKSIKNVIEKFGLMDNTNIDGIHANVMKFGKIQRTEYFKTVRGNGSEYSNTPLDKDYLDTIFNDLK